jgi:hypothetical protein
MQAKVPYPDPSDVENKWADRHVAHDCMLKIGAVRQRVLSMVSSSFTASPTASIALVKWRRWRS